MNRINALRLALLGLFLSMFARAYATVPAEITTLHTDIDTEWGVVKTAVIGFAAFSLLMFVVFKIKRKTG